METGQHQIQINNPIPFLAYLSWVKQGDLTPLQPREPPSGPPNNQGCAQINTVSLLASSSDIEASMGTSQHPIPIHNPIPILAYLS